MTTRAAAPPPPAGALLAIHPGALGDVVLAFRVIASLRPLYGTIDLAAQGHLVRLAADLGVAGYGLPVESALFASLYTPDPDPRLVARLEKYTAILVFSVDPGLAEAIGSCTGARVLQVQPRPQANRRTHVQDDLFRQLAEAGIRVEPAGHRRKTSVPARPDRVLIHPGASSPRKRLAPAVYTAVGHRLAQDGWCPRYVLGPSELALQEIFEDSNAGTSVETVTDLDRLRRLLASAGALVGNDSGISHLAAFMGLPTVAVFGPTDPLRWSPRGRSTAVVSAPKDCRPCYELEPANCPSPVCIDTVTPDRIIAAFRKITAAERER